jgi:hypothetical protein
MKTGSVEYRLGKMLEHDWRAEAAELLRAREAGLESGKVSPFGGFLFFPVDSLLQQLFEL